MARPPKCRCIRYNPKYTYFKPTGIPLIELGEVTLTLDELEAIRLADIESLYHEEAANKMGISRQTFDRILTKAHTTVADALVNGKAIKIEGGNVMLNERRFRCSDCGHIWTIAYGTGRPSECPSCQSKNIHRAAEDRGPPWTQSMWNVKGRGRCIRGKNKAQ